MVRVCFAKDLCDVERAAEDGCEWPILIGNGIEADHGILRDRAIRGRSPKVRETHRLRAAMISIDVIDDDVRPLTTIEWA